MSDAIVPRWRGWNGIRFFEKPRRRDNIRRGLRARRNLDNTWDRPHQAGDNGLFTHGVEQKTAIRLVSVIGEDVSRTRYVEVVETDTSSRPIETMRVGLIGADDKEIVRHRPPRSRA
jgi:hypothetical protein